MRSVATINSSSLPSSYVSRTLPRAKSLSGSSVSVRGGPAITTGGLDERFGTAGVARSPGGYSQTQTFEGEIGVLQARPRVEDPLHPGSDALHHVVILLQQRTEAGARAVHGFHRRSLHDEVGV